MAAVKEGLRLGATGLRAADVRGAAEMEEATARGAAEE
jgi:hypothetical protein